MEKSNLPRVTEILRVEGISDFSKVPQDLMERAQKFGSAVHKMTELWDKGILNIEILDKNLIPYLEAWKKFKSDFKVYVIDEVIEKHFVSKKFGFCGTPDRLVYINNKLTLIDIKSSTSMYPSTEIQTVAYQILIEESQTNCKVSQRWGVQLREDGTYKVEPYKESSDRSVFLSALNLYNYKKRKGLL